VSKATPAPLPDLNQQLLAWPEGTGTGLPNGRGSALIRSDGHGLDLTHDNRTWQGSPPNSARYFISTHMRNYANRRLVGWLVSLVWLVGG
jgi:hypothetical protein